MRSKCGKKERKHCLTQTKSCSIQNKSTSGEPIPLDSDLEGFWDITYPLIDKVKEKFAKLDARKAKQWALIEEYDPEDSLFFCWLFFSQ